ncbi:MAG: 3-deoxy-D-manno-octulosonic acid transferase, partial [Phycisphaerae bacterium]|nr:3-deoxy-D-manno-octulosonic acid transferase [Saprospiraceae bacterium]
MDYLMLLMYEFAIRLFTLGIQMAAIFNTKARLWVQGRKDWRQKSKVKSQKSTVNGQRSTVNGQKSKVNGQKSKVLWLHAASLGEFEQGRPVIEAFRERFPDWKIVLTFFSPSGYEVRKNYPHADLVCYLPADTRRNARDFLDLIQPDIAIFVKYEFWANYLFELKKRGIPTLLVSALFRPSQPFFKGYGGFWRKMLGCFTHIFVQNGTSGKLLQSVGIQNFTIAGDTRVDRVLKIAESAPENEIVKAFVGAASSQVLVVGSSWEPDQAVIFRALQLRESFKLS